MILIHRTVPSIFVLSVTVPEYEVIKPLKAFHTEDEIAQCKEQGFAPKHLFCYQCNALWYELTQQAIREARGSNPSSDVLEAIRKVVESCANCCRGTKYTVDELSEIEQEVAHAKVVHESEDSIMPPMYVSGVFFVSAQVATGHAGYVALIQDIRKAFQGVLHVEMIPPRDIEAQKRLHRMLQSYSHPLIIPNQLHNDVPFLSLQRKKSQGVQKRGSKPPNDVFFVGKWKADEILDFLQARVIHRPE